MDERRPVATLARLAADGLARTVGRRSSQRLRAATTCAHCSRTLGDLEWYAAAPWRGVVLRPAAGGPALPVPAGARLRCAHCGGPVFAGEPETIHGHPVAPLRPVRRGRPRKVPALEAS